MTLKHTFRNENIHLLALCPFGLVLLCLSQSAAPPLSWPEGGTPIPAVLTLAAMVESVTAGGLP